MTKSEIKTGMRVKTRDGVWYLALTNTTDAYGVDRNILVTTNGDWLDLIRYRENLNHAQYENYDIIMVETPFYPNQIFHSGYSNKTIWEREEPKEMTIEEIQNELGYKIKVVENKK